MMLPARNKYSLTSDLIPEDTEMYLQARNRSQEDLTVNKNSMLINQTWEIAQPKAQATGEKFS